ncbi:MAG: U32 family peptidase [Planctomycetales bacterium]|nr:U32 family peptidase [Planctomycetales bacterium]
MRTIELLAPARDFEAARAAVLCGADAVYIGAERFSARAAAGNSIETIRRVVELAHPYYVRVYAAMNTLLTDDELSAAEKMIYRLYEAGIDGLIVQDAGLLELDLPPLPMIASTQMNNDSLEQLRFREAVGFSRVILARELTLEQIRRIRRDTSIELECFIHGALCVGASGQCYLSYALGGRSGNRGQCAQPCRRLYTLKDAQGRTIVKDRYLLSLKDLNLSEHLESLMDAGVTSFKIEGRLKDAAYVANTVGYYRRLLDGILHRKGFLKSSSGISRLTFKPDPHKTFSRGFTDYGINGNAGTMAFIDTPKSIGEYVGTVKSVQCDSFVLDKKADLHSGDGLCFFDADKNLAGTAVNRAEGQTVWPQKTGQMKTGTRVYRNYDHLFYKRLQRPGERKIAIALTLRDADGGVALAGCDADGNEAVFEMACDRQPAQKKEQAWQTAATQLQKLGGTPFECGNVRIATQDRYFFPVSVLNGLKRGVVEALMTSREKNRPRLAGGIVKNDAPYPGRHLTFRGNVLNEKARLFYARHGVESIEPAAESGRDLHDAVVMTTKYCLRKQLNQCPQDGQAEGPEPLLLEDEDGNLLRAEFRCGRCGMDLYWIS